MSISHKLTYQIVNPSLKIQTIQKKYEKCIDNCHAFLYTYFNNRETKKQMIKGVEKAAKASPDRKPIIEEKKRKLERWRRLH